MNKPEVLSKTFKKRKFYLDYMNNHELLKQTKDLDCLFKSVNYQSSVFDKSLSHNTFVDLHA